MENELNILKTIKKAEVSPFLYTRIVNAIETRVKETVPVKWVWASALSLVIILIINISVIQKSKNSGTTNLTETFSLNTTNMLYND